MSGANYGSYVHWGLLCHGPTMSAIARTLGLGPGVQLKQGCVCHDLEEVGGFRELLTVVIVCKLQKLDLIAMIVVICFSKGIISIPRITVSSKQEILA